MSDTLTKPAIVLVHGAFHVPEHFDDLAKGLRDQGYEVVAPRLASTLQTKDPGNGIELDAKVVETAVREFTDNGRDVVLHMHSYGGVPGSEAAAAIGQQPQDPAKGKIQRLIYLAAFTLLPGEIVMEQYKGIQDDFPTEVTPENLVIQHDAQGQYYSGSPKQIADAAAAKVVPHALSPFITPQPNCGWRDSGIPVTYIVCEEDVGLHTPIQNRFVERMQDMGIDLKVNRMKSDHSPFAHSVDDYTKVLQESLA